MRQASGALLRPSASGKLRVVCPLAPLEAFRCAGGAHPAGGDASAAPFALQRGARAQVLLATSPPADWRAARVVAVVDLEAASPPLRAALRPLLSHGAWALGWPPAAQAAQPAELMALEPTPAAARAAAGPLCLAVLEVDASPHDPPPPRWASAARLRRGAPLALAGAPFGALAPAHFTACVAAGCVANPLPAPSHDAAAPPAAMLLDARTLPGGEGGPVACGVTGDLIGLLLPPLRPRAIGAPEVSTPC